ncbi:hypothetical protein [Mitsuaria sp. GD03876]|nr:hypothetical protein [Mitsuaria sp. GD03876]MDH0868068.1 hypothetical protein [Mitsuaria sp. GD03876]
MTAFIAHPSFVHSVARRDVEIEAATGIMSSFAGGGRWTSR